MASEYIQGRARAELTEEKHPHLSPSDTWKTLFETPTTLPDPADKLAIDAVEKSTKDHPYFTPSKLPAYKEILRKLAESPIDTITIVALGPLTNLALAAAEDPEIFLKAKEVVVMGGAIDVPGNVCHRHVLHIH